MQLKFRQRLFSWFDSYDVYDEHDHLYFQVQGRLSFGHLFQVYDKNGILIGELKEEIFHFLPQFSLYQEEKRIGSIQKKLTFLKPRFTLDYKSWEIQGDYMQWKYKIVNKEQHIATIKKELFQFTDTYILDIPEEENAFAVLMIVLAIDAVKCNQNG